MRWASWTGSIAVALMVAVGCGVGAGAADAMSFAGNGGAAEVAAPVQRTAHQPTRWHWNGGWWRYGPWADHGIEGIVITGPWSDAVFVPWGAKRLRQCAAKYRSFDAATGTYVTSRGERRICR